MGDPQNFKELTGLGIKDLMGGKDYDSKPKDDTRKTSINLGTYVLT